MAYTSTKGYGSSAGYTSISGFKSSSGFNPTPPSNNIITTLSDPEITTLDNNIIHTGS